MDPTTGLAATVSTLQGIITGAVGCTILSVVANVVLWKRLTLIQDETKQLAKECAEEMKLSRESHNELRHVLEAILTELRRNNGVEPSIPGLRAK